jgi:hypothetical protein
VQTGLFRRFLHAVTLSLSTPRSRRRAGTLAPSCLTLAPHLLQPHSAGSWRPSSLVRRHVTANSGVAWLRCATSCLEAAVPVAGSSNAVSCPAACLRRAGMRGARQATKTCRFMCKPSRSPFVARVHTHAGVRVQLPAADARDAALLRVRGVRGIRRLHEDQVVGSCRILQRHVLPDLGCPSSRDRSSGARRHGCVLVLLLGRAPRLQWARL